MAKVKEAVEGIPTTISVRSHDSSLSSSSAKKKAGSKNRLFLSFFWLVIFQPLFIASIFHFMGMLPSRSSSTTLLFHNIIVIDDSQSQLRQSQKNGNNNNKTFLSSPSPQPSPSSPNVRNQMRNENKKDIKNQIGHFHWNYHTQINELINESTIMYWPQCFADGERDGRDDGMPYCTLQDNMTSFFEPFMDSSDFDMIKLNLFYVTKSGTYIHRKETDFVRRQSESEIFIRRKKKVDVIFTSGYTTLCKVSKVFQKHNYTKKHVLITELNENWGALSEPVHSRTFDWPSYQDYWRGHGCSEEDVLSYINHPNTLAIFTMQFQAFDNPKVHSIPIGIRNDKRILDAIRSGPPKKTKLLMINHNDVDGELVAARSHAKVVIENFNGTVRNTYCHPWDAENCPDNQTDVYFDELRRSKFVLSPGGVGWDCYRIWDSLYVGTFPIIEKYNRTDGWHRTLENLPILWVDTFSEVTPEKLESEYIRLSSRSWDFQKLTVQWWSKFINSFRLSESTL